MKSRKRKIHVATGTDSYTLREFCVTRQHVVEGDVIFHIAQCLAFLIQGSDASLLAQHARIPRNKFAIRKLKSTLKMLDEVFETSED